MIHPTKGPNPLPGPSAATVSNDPNQSTSSTCTKRKNSLSSNTPTPKEENPTSRKKTRRRRSPPLSPENEARLKALILSILKSQNPLSTPPPSPNPQDPIDKNPKRNPDPDGSASAIFSTNTTTAQTIYHLTTRPHPIQTNLPNPPLNPPLHTLPSPSNPSFDP